MRYRILLLLVAILLAVGFTSHASFQNPANTAEKPLYHAAGNEATVFGTVSLNGEVPQANRIDMSADPACQQVNKQPRVEWLLTNEQKLLNAFVYVKEGEALKTYRFAAPDSEVVLEHKKCNYSPRVLGLRVGQPLSIVNADPTFHNTHAVPKNNPEWNQTQPAGAPPFLKRFTRPELFIPLKDNQHPWEKAYLSVLSHPFFAVTDELGNYEIRGLPPGTYKLGFWHERLGEQEIEVTVGANESRRIDILFNNEKLLEGTQP